MVNTFRIVDSQSQNPAAFELTQMSSLFHPLADELMAVASRLRCAAGDLAPHPVKCESCQLRMPRPTQDSLALARSIYALRRKRTTIFGKADLFGEPAWDILLDLFIAQGECKDVSVSSACIGSAAPPTTGLRWLGVLADEGLVVRENDPEDNRRVLVKLTKTGFEAMTRFFEDVVASLQERAPKQPRPA